MNDEIKQTRSEYFTWLSHEVRQPLNKVIEVIAHMLSMELSPVRHKAVLTILHDAQDLVMLINDVLDLTRLEEGNFRLAVEPVDPRNVLLGLADQLSPEFSERGITLSSLVHPEVPAQLLGDAGRLRQMLANIARVALHTATGVETILDAVLAAETEDEVRIEFSVHTTGGGVPIGMCQLINTDPLPLEEMSNECFGFGLQIALVQRLAAAMGGKFAVDFDPAQGVTYRFTLPYAKAQAVDEHRPVASVRGMRLLIVGDDEDNSAQLLEQLAGWGCIVRETQSPKLALSMMQGAVANETPFDALIIATRLMGQEAEDLGRAVRANEKLDKTSLIMLTSTGRRGDAARLREIGFTAYLTHPLKPARFFQTLINIAALKDSDLPMEDRKIITRHSLQEGMRGQRTILCMDADSVGQLAVTHLLDKLGYRTKAVSDLEDALLEIEGASIDLVLLDARSLTTLGRQVVENLRQKLTAREVPVPIIGLYAGAEPAQRLQFVDAGADDALPKPLQIGEVQQTMEKWLDRDEVFDAERRLTDKPITLNMLLEAFDHNDDLVRRTSEKFTAQVSETFELLKRAWAEEDIDRIAMFSEEIKELAELMRVAPLRGQAFELEKLARSGKLSHAAGRMNKLEELLRLTLETLNKLDSN
ncbi:MAG TPA: response regulator [bacterium]|nr:response regulator [bacterium]